MENPKAETNRKLRVRMLEGKACIGSFVRDGEQQFTIGSSKTADIVLPGKKVSGIHAMLRVTAENNVILYDLGSKNGTFVLGKKIVQSQLDTGSQFEIGNQKFRVDLLEADMKQAPEHKLFWEARGTSADILDIAVLHGGKLGEMFHLEANERLRVGYEDGEFFLEGLERNMAFVERKRLDGGAEGAYCFLPLGFVAEIYDAKNQLVGSINKTGEYFCISQGQKARLIGQDSEIHIYWRRQEVRVDRANPDPENRRFKESVSVSLALSMLIVAIMSFMPTQEKEEELAEKKSGYYRVTRTEPTQAEAPAPTPAPSAPMATVDQVVEKEPVAKVVAKQPVQQPVQQIAKVVAPEPPKPNQQTVAVQSALSNLLNRSLAKNLPVSDRGRKVMQASIVPVASGASGLKQDIGGQATAGAVNTGALASALKQGTAGAAAGMKGFQGGSGIGLSNGFGNGPPSMDIGMGDSEAETSGGLDKGVIAAIVREHLGQIKHCYERQLLVDPNIFGKVVANWTINAQGVVDATSVKKTTMGNVAVENCVLSKIKTWKFPKPRGGGKVIVSYPFLFKSVN